MVIGNNISRPNIYSRLQSENKVSTQDLATLWSKLKFSIMQFFVRYQIPHIESLIPTFQHVKKNELDLTADTLLGAPSFGFPFVKNLSFGLNQVLKYIKFVSFIKILQKNFIKVANFNQKSSFLIKKSISILQKSNFCLFGRLKLNF